jgi:hypothetical protein
MQKGYDDSSRQIKKFRDEIYSYCDNCEINSEVLFPAFMELLPDGISISRKDLAVITSDILNELIDKRVLGINGRKSNNPYAFYKVLPHEPLMDYLGFVNKKRLKI